MKHILITGGTGFIGWKLYNSLIKDNYVVVLSKSKKQDREPFVLINKDINDISEIDLIGIDEVYHLASTVDNYNIQTDPYLDVNVNINGTIALLEACRKVNSNIPIVYVSTFFVHGNPTILPATPNEKPEPLGLYGSTKLCAEHICKTYNRVYNMNIKIVRLSNVYGVGDQYQNNKKSAFSRMIYLAYKNEPINLYDGGVIRRDYIYVDDVVSALKTVMELGSNSEIYYIGNGIGVRFIDLVNTIVRIVGGSVKNIPSPVFHKQVGIDDFWCDITPLKLLGWKPKINIEYGIKLTADDIRGQCE